MPRALLLAQSQPRDSAAESEFNRWYNDVHVPQILRLFPEVVSARRYSLAADQPGPTGSRPLHRYLTIYEVESDDPQSVVNGVVSAMRDGRLDPTDSLDRRGLPPSLTIFSPVPTDEPRHEVLNP